MFRLFRMAPTPHDLVDRLRSPFSDTVALVSAIDGPFTNLYEPGVFVASVATAKILTFKKVDPPAFADQFNAAWVDFLINSYAVDGTRPSKTTVVERLQEKFPVYREFFLKTIDPDRQDKAHDNAVQVIWELFSNCTGKQKPEREGGFLNLVVASNELIAIGLRTLKAGHE
jgi:hypothetical protein